MTKTISKHARLTSGPWLVHPRFKSVVYKIDPDGEECIIADLGQEYLSQSVYSSPAYSDQTKNANMVAAAPDLYQALEAALNAIEWYRDNFPEAASEADYEFLNQANAAIAKAEGRGDA